MRRSFLCLAALMLTTLPLTAGKVQVWHHTTAEQFKDTKCENVVIRSDGALRLARHLQPLNRIAGKDNVQVEHVWDVVEGKNGNLYVATGNEGKIFKIDSRGKLSLVHQCQDSQVFCLKAASDGTIYAGTGPTGQVLRITPRGKVTVLARNRGEHVWSLALDPKESTIYAGTGPQGRIYRIDQTGKAKTF